ncbi:MAG TPA: LPS export ABC transporter permease LptF [Candidatus Eisenbacteria bacterium]|nr:LPS export ABC transporter permease LptF [Candidatus Eisenbacteria bacterium]
MGKIVHRYLFREILVPFGLGLSIFTFVLLLARLLRLIELVVNRGVPFTNVARIFLCLLPAFLEVTVPMAMLLAILVAFGRLSADAEITALRSSGVSLYQLVPPVATFVVIVTIITAALAWYARPWGNRALRTAMWDVARTRATAGLKPQIFNDDFPGLIIYAEQIDATDHLDHVLIADERDPEQQNTIFAREGLMIPDPERETLTLRLLEGTIHTSDTAEQVSYQTDFKSYDVNLDLRATLADSQQRNDDPKELTLPQLTAAIEAKTAAGKSALPELVEYHRKFSIPFACVVFGLVAMPLGIQPARAVRSRGFAVSLVVIFTYYILLSTGQGFAEQGSVPAVVGLWLPNVALGILGLVLFRRAARERPLVEGRWLERLTEGLRRAVARTGYAGATG